MDIVIRAAIAFSFVFLLTRVVGRRELSSLEPFDLIMLIMMGDLVQQGVTQSDYSVTGIFLAAGTLALMTVLVSYLSFRFKRLRPILDGEPLVILQDGKPIDANLRRERLTLEEVAQEARIQQIASLDEVEWAVLERTGQISFIKKSGS
jgi:Predicted membrane protein